jgi:hypothetical protein
VIGGSAAEATLVLQYAYAIEPNKEIVLGRMLVNPSRAKHRGSETRVRMVVPTLFESRKL